VILVLQSILGFIIVLGVLVTIHEFGHFAMAKLFKFPVEVFSIGFGPRVWGFHRRETDYRLSWIPLGGYVKVMGLGLDESDLISRETPDAVPRVPGHRGKRFVIFMAGPAINALFALVFASLSFMLGIQVPAILDQPVRLGYVDPAGPAAQAGIRAGDELTSVAGRPLPNWQAFSDTVLISGGETVEVGIRRDGQVLHVPVHVEKKGKYLLGNIGVYPLERAVIERVTPASPADKGGLRGGDIIVAVNGKPVGIINAVIEAVRAAPGRAVSVEVMRGGERLRIELTPALVDGAGQIGVMFRNEAMIMKKYPFVASVRHGFDTCVDGATLSYRFLKKLLSGKGSIRQVSGPIDMARFSGEAIQEGLSYFVWLLGMVSLQLAIFNFLPIPLLDGGHLFILGIEAVRRRDLSVELKFRLLQTGFMILASLFVMVLVFDVLKLL